MDGHFSRGVGVLTLALLLVSCGGPEVEYYEIPKEDSQESGLPDGHPPVTPESSARVGGPVDAPSDSLGLTWDIPEKWVGGKPSSIRLGSYTLPDLNPDQLDISVTRFPGDVGGLFSNVNRWRRQLNLPSLTDPEQLEDYVAPYHSEAFTFHWVEFANEADPPKKVIVGVLSHGGASWFFKMTGDKKRVESQEASLRSMLQSVRVKESGS